MVADLGNRGYQRWYILAIQFDQSQLSYLVDLGYLI